MRVASKTCVRGDAGRCVQCGRELPERLYIKCSGPGSNPPPIGAYLAVDRRQQFIDWLERELRRMTPCAWLGAETGKRHKTKCNRGRLLDEHRCNHVSRRKVLRGRIYYGTCTPGGKCQQHEVSLGIRPCEDCPLHQAQLRLGGRD